MSLSPDTITAIKTLVAQDQFLLEQLAQATDASSAARLVAEAARRQGLDANVADIETYFVAQRAHDVSEISDDDLETIAGGMAKMDASSMVAMSIFSFGIGCLVYSKEHQTLGGCTVTN